MSEPVLYYGDLIAWNNPLNRKLVARWQILPWARGDRYFHNIAKAHYNNAALHGVLTNVAVPAVSNSGLWATNRKGGYAELRCDGTDDHVLVGDVLGFERTDAFSGSCWAYTVDTALLAQMLVGKLSLVGPNFTGWGFQFFRRATLTSTSITFFAINTPSNSLEASCGPVVSTNTWYHAGFTYDGSSSASGLKLYFDGKLQTNVVFADNLTASLVTSAQLAIGARDPTGPIGQLLKGSIDDVRIWNRVLSDSEMNEVYVTSQKRHDPTLNWIQPVTYSFPTAAARRVWQIGDNPSDGNADGRIWELGPVLQ